MNLSVIILAGGKSSRMGQDKALITIDSLPLITRTYYIADQLSKIANHYPQKNIYIITPWAEKYQDILPENKIKYLTESIPHQGPIIGFYTGLLEVIKIKSDWVLLLACDLPKLSINELEKWYNQIDLAGKYLAYLPYQNDRWEPLCGFYHKHCLPSLQDYINSGGRSFQGWLKQLEIQQLQVSDNNILFNCNYPEDLFNL